MYHRQIFKILLSNKVLDDPRQRRLFKTTDLVELFNLNEPINGQSSESDRLFRDSKLTPETGGFSLSKIEEMRKLASALSKKISATIAAAKPTCSEHKNANDNACERESDEPNNNSRCNRVTVAVENCSSETGPLPSQQSSIQECSNDDNQNDLNSNVDGKRDTNVENNDTSKNKEQNVAPMKSTNDKVEKVLEKEDKAVSSDGKTISLSPRKRKRKKENISAMFEGERVSCLIGRRLGRSNDKEESVSSADDNYVLRKLFAKSSN